MAVEAKLLRTRLEVGEHRRCDSFVSRRAASGADAPQARGGGRRVGRARGGQDLPRGVHHGL